MGLHAALEAIGIDFTTQDLIDRVSGAQRSEAEVFSCSPQDACASVAVGQGVLLDIRSDLEVRSKCAPCRLPAVRCAWVGVAYHRTGSQPLVQETQTTNPCRLILAKPIEPCPAAGTAAERPLSRVAMAIC